MADKKLRLTVIVFSGFLLIAALWITLCFKQPHKMNSFYIKGCKIFIERAVTDSEKSRGLSYRKALKENQTMLFVFDEEKHLYFWMKDMRFPLDIIWLDKNCKVIDLSIHQPPCENYKNCPVITSGAPAKYILETVQGFVKKHAVRINDKFEICF